MRLLEIWLAVRTADRGDLDGLEAETDEILDASVRADARGQAAESEVRLVSLLISHVREAIQRRRAGNGERFNGAPFPSRNLGPWMTVFAHPNRGG